MLFAILLMASATVGIAGALVISRDPFRALATGGTPGFAAALATTTAARRESVRAWLKACRHQTTAACLALAAAGAIFVIGWLALGLLAMFVREHTGLVQIDASVARWAHLHAGGVSGTAVSYVTLLGDTFVVGGLVVLFAAADWFLHRNGRVVLFLLAVFIGEGAITLAIKTLMNRMRPTFNPIAHTLGPSFPSGHSSTAAACFAAMALLLSRSRSRRSTALLGGAAVAIAVAVASSRVFLDVHWLSDVLAGVALGWAWFAFCAIAFGGPPRHRPRRAAETTVGRLASA